MQNLSAPRNDTPNQEWRDQFLQHSYPKSTTHTNNCVSVKVCDPTNTIFCYGKPNNDSGATICRQRKKEYSGIVGKPPKKCAINKVPKHARVGCIHWSHLWEAYLHKLTHAYDRTNINIYIRAWVHTTIHLRIHKHTCIHTYIHTYINTYTYIHAYIHTYVRTYILNVHFTPRKIVYMHEMFVSILANLMLNRRAIDRSIGRSTVRSITRSCQWRNQRTMIAVICHIQAPAANHECYLLIHVNTNTEIQKQIGRPKNSRTDGHVENESIVGNIPC